MNNRSTVSIGLPVYNGENFIVQAIESVLTQTYRDFELVITDNASTDRTQQICLDYAARDPRIRYYRNDKNLGAAPNYNRAFELSSGKYFKWLAHDDLIAPAFLERCVAVLESDPSIVLCFTEVEIVDEQGQQIATYDIHLNTHAAYAGERYRALLLEWHMCFDVFGLIRSDILRRTAVMGNYSHGDGVLLAHLSLLGRFHTVHECLFSSRRHAKQSMRLFGYAIDQGGNDYHAYAAWFDSAHKSKIFFPNWRIAREYEKAILRSDIQWYVKLHTHFYLLWWLAKNRGHLWHDLVVAGRLATGYRPKQKQVKASAVD